MDEMACGLHEGFNGHNAILATAVFLRVSFVIIQGIEMHMVLRVGIFCFLRHWFGDDF